MNKEPEKVIVDILLHELDLPVDYGTVDGNVIPSAIIGSQNALLTNTDKLQIIVQSISDKCISNNYYNDEVKNNENTVYTERTEQIIFSTMQVDIQSRNNDARTRRHEILSALSSTYSQQQQELYACRIFGVPQGFINTGDIQGGSALNRWTIRFKMTYKTIKVKEIDYFEHFKSKVYTENTDFTIDWN